MIHINPDPEYNSPRRVERVDYFTGERRVKWVPVLGKKETWIQKTAKDGLTEILNILKEK